MLDRSLVALFYTELSSKYGDIDIALAMTRKYTAMECRFDIM